MKIPSVEEMRTPGEARYVAMLELQSELDLELKKHFEEFKDRGRETLARALIEKVESIVEELNARNYRLGRIEYSGDRNYEDSEQWFGNGADMGAGLVLHFHGFSVQVSWVS